MSPDEGLPPTHEPDAGPTSSRVTAEAPPAKEQRSHRPGWIWAIPLAALGIVAWLGFKQFAASGPLITVTFDNASGMQAGSTQVEYQGITVGEVENLHLQKDLRHVDTSIRMNGDLEGHLGKGTLFWLNGASPSLTDLRSLKSIIAGPTIGIEPRPGPKQDRYVALSEPPVVPESAAGRRYVLHADTLSNVSPGSNVYFEDLKVGVVESTKLQPDRSFEVTIFVDAPFERLVHTGTRFWSAGAVQVSMGGNGPRLQLQSAAAMLQGAVAFETPRGAREGAEAPEQQRFRLYDSKEAAMFAPGPQAVSYRVVFDASGGGLDAGAAVKLAGKRVGTVQESKLEFDQEAEKLRQRVTIALEPSEIGLSRAEWPADTRPEMDALLNRLVAQGLRAQLGNSIPLVGSADVELAFVEGASGSRLIPGDARNSCTIGRRRVAGRYDGGEQHCREDTIVAAG
jgi:paraquat-inducible protein B